MIDGSHRGLAGLLTARVVLGVAWLSACSGANSSALPRDAPAVVAATTRLRAGTAPAPTCDWARGWARHTIGGRGGRVIRVTTLSPVGPGSLSEALAAPEPRTIVFEVGGVIDLQLAKLRIDQPFVTIAGQTAPSPGITLIRGGISVSTHDVVIQHIRVRPGSSGQAIGWQPDGISSGSGSYNFVVDHCSISWAVDENLSASGNRFEGASPEEWRKNTSHDVTFSHNIVAEGLAHATHEKGEHSKGSLIHDNVTGVLVYGNLYVSNMDRNPLFKGGARGVVANNWIVNPGKHAMQYTLGEKEWAGRAPERGQMTIVGNVFHHGRNTPSGTPLLFSAGVGSCDVYLRDNLALDSTQQPVAQVGGEIGNLREVTEPPSWPPGLTAAPASGVVEWLARDVGARPWDRDAIDARLVQQAKDGSASLTDSEQAVGGYPEFASTRAEFDPQAWDPCMRRITTPLK